MEILALIAILVIGIILVGSILGFVAMDRIGKLQGQIRQLRSEFLNADIRPEHKSTTSPPSPVRPQTRPEAPPVRRPKVEPREKKKPQPEPAKVAAVAATAAPTLQHPKPAATPLKTRDRKPAPKKKRRSFEEELGARWAVWVGGIALAFGAIFLLRYTIEAGVFSPAMRVGIAALMGLLLVAAGEFLRRADGKPFKKLSPQANRDEKLSPANNALQAAYIPGVLTGVGIFTLFGSIYAAYGLYHFFGPTLAFALLALVSIAALALSLLHGPKMAGFGLVASLVTPLLIQTNTPNYIILFTYLIAVCVCALALAKYRKWGAINLMALFGGLAWGFLSITATTDMINFGPWLIFIGFLFAASTYIGLTPFVATAQPTNAKIKLGPIENTHTNLTACLWALGAALLFLLVAGNAGFKGPQAYAVIGFGFVLMAVGWRIPIQKANIFIGGGTVFFALLFATHEGLNEPLSLGLAGATIAVVTALSFLNTRSEKDTNMQNLWSAFSAVLPLALVLALSVLLNLTSTKIAIGLCGLMVLNAAQAYWLWVKYSTQKNAMFIYTLAGAACYVLAVLFGFSGLTESLLLIAGIIIAAGLYKLAPLYGLRLIASGFGILSIWHTLDTRIPKAGAIRDTVILNELWLYFALPAILCVGAYKLIAPRTRDIWSEGLKALTLTFAALFFVFQVRHLMNGGNVMAHEFGFDELSLQVLVGLCFTLGGTLVGKPSVKNTARDITTQKPYELLIPGLATVVSLVTLLVFAVGMCLAYNPLLNEGTTIKGNFAFNGLVLAYLLPAVLLAGIAYLSRTHRPILYIRLVGGLALISIMLYLTSMVRFLFSGQDISIFAYPPIDVEMYTISAVWLVFGIALLGAGLKLKRRDLRVASAFVIILTVLKAFLFDMASLEGVLRAMSFVVLGLVLIVIGRVYQKLLFAQKQNPPQEET